MADEAASSSTSPQDDLAVSISIVSPSVTVNAPLNFPNLPSSTTIGQVKQKIRDALGSKPTNEHQRLIHQGKLLQREQDTFLQVFGEQKLRESDQLIFHLVIREAPSTADHPSPSQTTAPRGPSPVRSLFGTGNTFAASPQPNPQGSPHHPHPHHHHHFPRDRFGRPVAMPSHPHAPFPGPFGGQPMGTPAGPPGSLPATIAQMQAQAQAHAQALQAQAQAQAFQAHQQHEMLHNHMNQVNQRPSGVPGQQPIPGMAPGAPGSNIQGWNGSFPVNQPQPFVQQGIGPNGEVYRVTMNSAIIGPNGPMPVPPMAFQQGHMGPPAPGSAFSTNDVQNILRNADASEQASSIMADAMRRSASGASLPNLATGSHRQPIPAPGVTVPRRPGSRPGSTAPLSRTATPDAATTPSSGSVTAAQGSSSSPASQPEVYIVNSPQGPRALLINGPSDLYYTPAARVSVPPMFAAPAFPAAPWMPMAGLRGSLGVDAGQPHAQAHPAAAPAQQQAPQQGNIRVGLYQGPAPQAQQAIQQPQQPQGPQPRLPHPVNPEGGVAGALLAVLWPHIWLMIRLALFVWWFTSNDTSWQRWIAVLTIAVTIFLVNTGIFNNIANDALNPLRQHLEGLLPFGNLGGDVRNRRGDGAPAAIAQADQNGNNAPAAQGGRQQGGEPDPAQAAARLVEQRRIDNGNWLLDRVRRLERAGLLFLASIAPGVAERHIARIEAAARAERERVEAAERAERERREEAERTAADAASASADVPAEKAEGEGASDGQSGGEGSAGGVVANEEAQQPEVAA